MHLTRSDFGPGFKWGVSTAAYQVEGAHNCDGKGPSIWDDFVSRPGRTFDKQHARVACDFYHNYAKDLCLLKRLQVPNFRFSIAWSRIYPAGTGTVNTSGTDYYNRVIDLCLELDIEPWITLYHWDLPTALHEKGGWKTREIIDWFSAYVATCVRCFGDRVKNWMVLNEPMVFTGAGYLLGVHAPGEKNVDGFLSAAHHAAICQAEGGRVIRQLRPQSNIGTTFSCSHVEPFSQTAKDIAAANRADLILNRLFIEPLLGLGYPVAELKFLQKFERYFKAGDDARLAFDMDFIGIQNYTREIVRHAPLVPFVRAKIIKASRRKVPATLMNWEVYPPSIYHILKKFSGYKNIPQMIVTENGAAFRDQLIDGRVDDPERVSYLQEHVSQVHRAMSDGVRVNGYFVWTLLDNFEWAEGYYPTFGLVHVDFGTQKRTVKSSGHWYREFLGKEAAECRSNKQFP